MAKRAIFDKKNVLVVGGAGFIGSHICDELVKTSKVICVDNFSTGDERNIDHLLIYPDFEFIRHDVSDPIDLESFKELDRFKIQFQGIQEIYNLACPMSPKTFKENIINTLKVNSVGIKNLLEMAIKYESKLVHFSSSVVYGDRPKDNHKVQEEEVGCIDLMSERSCYDEGKRFAEAMILNYRDIYGIDAKIARIFRVYGPRMKLNDGHLFPDLVNAALEDKDLVIFNDKDFYSSFCYVSDIVDASLKFMESELKGPLNIGSDVDVKLGDFAQKIIDIVESKSKVVYSKEADMFVTPLCLPDTMKARDGLGWLPIVGLDKGLAESIDQLRASKGLRGFNQAV